MATENGWNATAQRLIPAISPNEPGSVTTDVECFDNPTPTVHVAMAAAGVSIVQQQSEDAVVMSQETENAPKISKLTEDSSDLTAMEKITKLKTQWLNQLP